MPELATPQLDALKEQFKDPARDVKLNLGTVLNAQALTAEQTWLVALASAYYIGDLRLRDALLADARAAGVGVELVEDAEAAAALMATNTVFYRFRHMVGKESYSQKPARLRMQWMARPRTSKGDFELASLAIAALAGCDVCIKAHEASVQQHGLGEDHVLEAVRIAAVLNGAAVALRS